jgi:death on curing protein
MREPSWVPRAAVIAVHEALIAEHGGALGIRDEGLLDSALARPRQIYTYEEGASLTRLAAAYAFGLAKNHAFVDGNKRIAWVVCAEFLRVNGRVLTATQADVVTTMLALASSSIDERQFAEWLERNCA